MVNFPTSYDNKASTFGDIKDNVVLTLHTSVNNSVTSIRFTETAVVDALDVPCYLTFEVSDASDNFEILKVTSKGTAGTGYVNVTRGALSSTALAHTAGEKAVQDPVTGHLTSLRELIEAAQKFHALVGTSLPATCSPGEAYLDTSAQILYFCTATNVWTRVSRASHSNYGGLSDDDHPQYHNATRKAAWHAVEANVGGSHLTSAAAHNHDGSGTNGAPAARFLSGPTANRPSSPSQVGQLFFDTSTGDLYFGADGLTWERYSVMPAGTIILFEDACPQGWTRVTEMDGKFPRGAAPGVWSGLADGGAASHTHTLSTVISHTHNIAEATFNLGYGGEHNHGFLRFSSSGGYNTVAAFGKHYTPVYVNTGSGAAHTHAVTIPTHNTSNSGSATVTTAGTDNLPPYVNLLFCKKS